MLNNLTNDELIRRVHVSTDATPMERQLAARLEALEDELEVLKDEIRQDHPPANTVENSHAL